MDKIKSFKYAPNKKKLELDIEVAKANLEVLRAEYKMNLSDTKISCEFCNKYSRVEDLTRIVYLHYVDDVFNQYWTASQDDFEFVCPHCQKSNRVYKSQWGGNNRREELLEFQNYFGHTKEVERRY